jgi:hypothetical protein
MVELVVLGDLAATKPSVKHPGSDSIMQVDNSVRPSITKSISEPMPLSVYTRLIDDSTTEEESSSDESRDIVDDTTLLPTLSRPIHARLPEERASYSTVDESPPGSRSSSPRCPSSITSPSVYTVESLSAYTTAGSRRQPSVLHRLRSSVSATLSPKQTLRRASIAPTDFRLPPEQPEKRFIDSIGVVCPGVTDRSQCSHPLAHLVSSFRMCQPIEYTTALADHGLTYLDYCRLLAALSDFLDRHAAELDKNAPLEMLSSTPGERQPFLGTRKSVAKRQQQGRYHGTVGKCQATGCNAQPVARRYNIQSTRERCADYYLCWFFLFVCSAPYIGGAYPDTARTARATASLRICHTECAIGTATIVHRPLLFRKHRAQECFKISSQAWRSKSV